jgi:hypothetical protein
MRVRIRRTVKRMSGAAITAARTAPRRGVGDGRGVEVSVFVRPGVDYPRVCVVVGVCILHISFLDNIVGRKYTTYRCRYRF